MREKDGHTGQRAQESMCPEQAQGQLIIAPESPLSGSGSYSLKSTGLRAKMSGFKSQFYLFLVRSCTCLSEAQFPPV
jgi:hypothetical protein